MYRSNYNGFLKSFVVEDDKDICKHVCNYTNKLYHNTIIPASNKIIKIDI